MKRLLVIFLSLILIIFTISNEKTETVFSENLEYTNLYEITFLNTLSTNNFLDYFSDIKVIWIKPKSNILYQNKLKRNKYFFKDISNEKNITIFKNEYINQITNLGYKNEVLKLKTSGIMIEKVKVYLENEQLDYIKNNINDIKIERVS